MPDQLILAASHKSPQNVAVPDMPLDLTGQLAKDLLDLTARLGARAERGPVWQSGPAGGARHQPAHGYRHPDRARHRRADPPSARCRLRRPRAAAGRLCGRYRHAAEHRRAGRSGAASAAARPERQPGALGRISRAGGTHALRRRVHRASRPSRCRSRLATPWPRPPADVRTTPDFASHRPPPISARRRVRAGRRRDRQRPRRAWTGSTRRCCRSRAPPGPIAGPNSRRAR